MNPKLSYVIATRNDGHCGDPMDRLENTLEQLQIVHPDAEIIVVDWGSDGDRTVKCAQWVHKFRDIYVSPATTIQYPLNFTETVALNVGIRRARGEWIARLDQDILVGEKFVEWFSRNPDLVFGDMGTDGYPMKPTGPAFFSTRRDIPQDGTGSQLSHPTNTPDFFRAAVGILLAPKTAWHQTRGYDESLTARNHMEHDLCLRFKRLCGLVNLGQILDAPFHHQWHERPTGLTDNPYREIHEIEKELDKRPVPNDENWGLGQHDFG